MNINVNIYICKYETNNKLIHTISSIFFNNIIEIKS